MANAISARRCCSMAVAERRRARAAANSASRSPPSSRVASTPTSALVMPPFVTRWSKPADRPISPFAEICGVYAARAARCRAAAAEVPNTAACTAGERPRARPTASSIVTVSAAAAGTAATSSTVTSMHVTAAPRPNSRLAMHPTITSGRRGGSAGRPPPSQDGRRTAPRTPRAAGNPWPRHAPQRRRPRAGWRRSRRRRDRRP